MDTNEHDRLSNITLIQYANVNSFSIMANWVMVATVKLSKE
jgi:hypothetical protein